MDTIFALASARGKAGVSVIRISGADALSTFQVFGAVPPDGTLLGPAGAVDQVLALRFDGPNSFTGENVVELHTHGSVAIVDTIMSILSGSNGFRLAEPGEFTRRALENERLDIAQVEGLADLIEAETEAQRRQAMKVFSGALDLLAEEWRTKLIRAAALLEATIDFVDEDVPVDVMPDVRAILNDVTTSLKYQVDGFGVAERIRDGFEVAIVGPPNAGKSTLLNTLAGRDAAITSDIAGTTRDIIEVRMDLRGLPVTFLDTAGLRDSDDTVEALGIEQARSRADKADLRVILLSGRGVAPAMTPKQQDLVLLSYADENAEGDISGKTGQGVDELIDHISSVLGQRAASAGVAIRERHRAAMRSAIEALGIARDRLDDSPELAEIVAEDLRVAVRALDSLVGRVDVEHVLDDVFSSFCIGK